MVGPLVSTEVHGIKDAKSLWAAIKSRFGGNVESKKMHKTVLKQQFKNFSVSETKGLDKAYDRFQKLISLLEVHGAAVPNEDANQKFLRALPSLEQCSLDMRKKMNVAFLFAEDTSSSNEVNTTNGVSTALGHKSQGPKLFIICTDALYSHSLTNLCHALIRVKQIYIEDWKKVIFVMDKETLLGLIKLRLNALMSIEGSILQGNVEHQEIKETRMEMQAMIVKMGWDMMELSRLKLKPTEFALMAPYTSNLKSKSQAYTYLFAPLNQSLLLSPVKGPLTRDTADKGSLSTGLTFRAALYQLAAHDRDKRRLIDYQDIDRGFVAFGEASRGAPNTRISNEKVNTVRVNGVNTAGQTAVSAVKGNGVTAVKASAGNPQQALKNKGIFDSGCSRHMTGNKDFLTDYQDIDGGFVAFGGSARGGKITGKGKIKTNKLDFEDVFFVKELKFNLFSVSQMCDKKNSVLFTDTECLVLSPDFKLLDKSQVLLRVPRQSNMYSFDLKNVVHSGDLTCLFAKAIIDEFKLWHRRLGHVNFKTMNKLIKGNLVRGLPLKMFDNDHTCVACQKGKQVRPNL
ncbi:ribonuclease H-like domain-containing protein [Tanacetum coccineum]|uniref:Ribonuclease H-like domain-containing protein n=1 Tax=Tanacetum coccineum TaxID=301880 RepID=A0ABQ5DLI7_9ASTR